MAYVLYTQSSVGGKQIADAAATLLKAADIWRDLKLWVDELGVGGMAGPDFGAGPSLPQRQALLDAVTDINAAVVAFMETNGGRALLAQVARGS